MWVLYQHNKDNSKFKYIVSRDYNVIISYINEFNDVKKYNDYLFISKDDIYFEIKLGDILDEKTNKKKSYNKKTNN